MIVQADSRSRSRAGNRGGSSPDTFASFDIDRVDNTDGSITLTNKTPLPEPLPDIYERFLFWANDTPDADLISGLDKSGRRHMTYGEARVMASHMARYLSSRCPDAHDTVAVVDDAGPDHAVVKLACLEAGLVHAPFSPALAFSESGRSRLLELFRICRPALVLLSPALPAEFAELLSRETLNFEIITACEKASDGNVLQEFQSGRNRPDDPAAIYFTSGSTGNAKGVMITRHMIAAVQGAISSHWPFLAARRPVLVDWLPWHHVFGGLDNFFKVIWNGGTYHVRPAPSPNSMAATAREMVQLEPNLYIDVPFGIKLLLDQLETDEKLSRSFFADLDLIFFAGAGMDGETWARLNRLIADPENGARKSLRVASGYGSTEAASTICLAHEEPGSPGEVGIPLPGHQLRLVDVDGRTEVRVRGPNVSPYYMVRSGRAPMPLDEQGYLCTGDVVAPVRPFHPELGLRFDGRVAEDFKLSNGTRVKVGSLRQMLLSACAPHLGDVAIAGENHDYVAALLFPTASAAGLDDDSLFRTFERALARHNDQWPGSSTAIRYAVIMRDALDPETGEVNDKGHLVQRRTLQNRAADVDRLYAKRPDRDVIVPGEPRY